MKVRMGKDGSPIVTCAKTGEEITLIQCSKCWLYGRCPYGYDFLTRKEQEQMEWEIACAEQRSYHVPEPPPPPCDHAVVIKPIPWENEYRCRECNLRMIVVQPTLGT